MLREIGSEYWLDKIPETTKISVPAWLSDWQNIVFTSSGRGAISLCLYLLDDKQKNKTALLPSYCCHTMIDPFVKSGYEVSFYDIDKNGLTPDLNSIDQHMNKPVSFFFHMGYFGFESNSNLSKIINELKKNRTIIIEDITHTLFSNLKRNENNDFYIASLRKWCGIPSGGFVSTKNSYKIPKLKNESEFGTKRLKALSLKAEFIKSGDDNLKNEFLDLFRSAENSLENDCSAYNIDNISIELLRQIDPDFIRKKRKENYLYLLDNLKEYSSLSPVFNSLPVDIVPLFMPVYIHDKRDDVQKQLVNEKIYAPIHWPKPEQIHKLDFDGSNYIYDNIISIPCDQRYGLDEMERICKVLKKLDLDK